MKNSYLLKFTGIMAVAMLCLMQPLGVTASFAQTTTHQDSVRMSWWAHARFGMFIHWGIYAVPAHAEWYMNNGHVPRAVYEKYAKEFDPTEFNADTWVKIAKNAGMKYLVITSKHHDGFCMFNTKATDYNVVKDTPWHKDPLKALSAACRRYGIHFGTYYSIMDWHSPYQGASDPNPMHPTYNPTHFKPGKKGAYIKYMKTQLKELITQYHPQIMWFDGGWMEGWTPKDGKGIYDYLRKLDPRLIINNRLTGAGDYETPEQQIPPNGIPGHYWETCMTINNDWGYNAADSDYKSSETLIRNLIDIASKGGNYLLNVGPTAMGVIPQPEVDRLDTMGAWLRVNGAAIYGTTASPFTTQLPWGRCTQKPGKLFFEVFDWPKDGKLVIHGVHSEPARAFILSDRNRTPLKVSREGDALVVNVPAKEPDTICTVVALDFAGKPVVYNPPVIGPKLKMFLGSTDITISSAPGTEIRYTLDGQPPASSSPVYLRPVTLTRPATVTACYFIDGQPVSGTSSATFTKAEAMPAVSLEDASSGVEYNYYTGEWTSVPDFKDLKPVREAVLPDFRLPKNRALQYYAIEYKAFVYIPESGVYTFYTSSDDGSRLYIGNNLVVDNDGLHGMTEAHGAIALAKGYHPIRVGYFQSQGSDGLEVKCEGPGFGNKPIPIPDTVIYFKR